jgi:hypothetical protein
MHSMLAVCPVPWLLGEVSKFNTMPRWRHTGLISSAPTAPVTLPVRDIRVMYTLRPRLYEGFAASQIPHAHEYFAPISAILGPGGWQHLQPRKFLGVRRRRRSGCGQLTAVILLYILQYQPAFSPIGLSLQD